MPCVIAHRSRPVQLIYDRVLFGDEVQMAFMTWTDDMSVGVAMFDAEHKEIVELINELDENMRAGSADLNLDKASEGLFAHTEQHLCHEEEYFERVQYPLAAEHKAYHDELRQQIVRIREEMDNGNSTVLGAELLRFLREWLVPHIEFDDKKYGAFLNTKGIN